MKADVNGCSTCQIGEERLESFYSKNLGRWMVQYEYRHANGKLFTTIAPDADIARQRKAGWIARGEAQ